MILLLAIAAKESLHMCWLEELGKDDHYISNYKWDVFSWLTYSPHATCLHLELQNLKMFTPWTGSVSAWAALFVFVKVRLIVENISSLHCWSDRSATHSEGNSPNPRGWGWQRGRTDDSVLDLQFVCLCQIKQFLLLIPEPIIDSVYAGYLYKYICTYLVLFCMFEWKWVGEDY